MSGSQWSKDEEMRLRDCVDQNMSASQIAARIAGYTRNAIIGKINRLGLRLKGAPSRPPRPPRQKMHRTKNTPTISLGRVQEPGPVQAGNLDLTGLAPTSFLDLAFDQCRFVISEDGKFCPLKQIQRSPYCAFHHRMTHAPCG